MVNNIVIVHVNNIVENDDMMNNIITILFNILSDLAILLTILLLHGYFVTILRTILPAVMAVADNVTLIYRSHTHKSLLTNNVCYQTWFSCFTKLPLFDRWLVLGS